MVERFEKVNEFASRLMRAGVMIFSPISHTHPIAQYELPKGWDFWQQYDRCILERCNGMIVCQFDGWENSVGIKAEIEIARELGLDVFFVCPQDEEEAAGFIARAETWR